MNSVFSGLTRLTYTFNKVVSNETFLIKA